MIIWNQFIEGLEFMLRNLNFILYIATGKIFKEEKNSVKILRVNLTAVLYGLKLIFFTFTLKFLYKKA